MAVLPLVVALLLCQLATLPVCIGVTSAESGCAVDVNLLERARVDFNIRVQLNEATVRFARIRSFAECKRTDECQYWEQLRVVLADYLDAWKKAQHWVSDGSEIILLRGVQCPFDIVAQLNQAHEACSTGGQVPRLISGDSLREQTAMWSAVTRNVLFKAGIDIQEYRTLRCADADSAVRSKCKVWEGTQKALKQYLAAWKKAEEKANKRGQNAKIDVMPKFACEMDAMHITGAIAHLSNICYPKGVHFMEERYSEKQFARLPDCFIVNGVEVKAQTQKWVPPSRLFSLLRGKTVVDTSEAKA